MNKRATNLTIDLVPLDEARALNINLSANLSQHQDRITRAVEMVFQGF